MWQSVGVLFFFFKQKTAYELRISDWSSDVCSSDLVLETAHVAAIGHPVAAHAQHLAVDVAEHQFAGLTDAVLQQCGDVAGTAGQVQHPVALAHLRRGDEIAFPDPMDAHRHQVVHQVVVAGHRREHLRSEEHTSELQSLMRISYAVFCLKKKQSYTRNIHREYDISVTKAT